MKKVSQNEIQGRRIGMRGHRIGMRESQSEIQGHRIGMMGHRIGKKENQNESHLELQELRR